MNWKGFGLLLFAAVLATAAGGIAYLYLKGAPMADAQVQETVPVVVATQDLSFATKLTEEHVRVAQFPKDAVPIGYYATIDSVLNRTTKIFLMEGESVLAIKLSEYGGGLSVRVPETMRASSLTVNDVSGVSGFVLPGDRVDVLCTIDNVKLKNNEAVTKTILQDIEVIASGVKTQTKNSDPVQVQTVTLLVDPNGAETLALGMHQGRIHLVLRNPADHEMVEVKPKDTRELLGLSEPTRRTYRAPRRTVAKQPEPEPKPDDPVYTIIRNGSIEQQKSPTEAKGSNP